MALPVNIEELIHGKVVEWERLEFKQDWNPEPILHTLCAYANDINNWGGGYIIVGIAEKDGRPELPPAGLNPERLDKLQGELTNLGHRILPNFLPIFQPYVIQNKHILIIWAPAGDMRPYTAPEGLGKGAQPRHSYIRSGSKTIIARGESLRRLQELTARIPFDDRINQQAELNDLSLGLIRDFLQEVKSGLFEESTSMPLPDLTRQMAIAKGPDEYLRPVNVGLMFFNKEPHKFFQRAWIEVVIRKDEAGKDFSEKYFKGPVHWQLREALGYIRSNIIEERVRKISGRAEADRYYNFPYDALEEALANAVYHKSYELAKPIEVQIWVDRIEILSFPGPVPPVDAKILAENKRIVARDYRNRRVGDFLKELHLTEGRGTGIPTMNKTLIQNGSPEPVFETDDQCTYFLIVLPVHPEWHPNHLSDHDEVKTAQRSAQGAQAISTGIQGNEKLSEQGSDQAGAQALSKEQRTILTICKEPRSRSEVLTEIGLTNHRKNYLKHIMPLIEFGLIELTIPETPTHMHQKYVLTDKGQTLLNQLTQKES